MLSLQTRALLVTVGSKVAVCSCSAKYAGCEKAGPGSINWDESDRCNRTGCRLHMQCCPVLITTLLLFWYPELAGESQRRRDIRRTCRLLIERQWHRQPLMLEENSCGMKSQRLV